MMKFVSAALLFALYGSNGYEFKCNHFDSYTTDVCYQPSSSLQYKYSCNSSRSINLYEYSDGDCGTSGAKPSAVTNYKARNSDAFQCDQKRSCDYARVVYYSDEECAGDDFYDYEYFVTDECYQSSLVSFVSYKYSCNGNALETTTYAGGNCTGYKLTTKTDFDDKYNSLYSGCYQLICEKGTASDTEFLCGVEMWAAIAIGVVLICLALLCICCVRRRRKLKRQLAELGDAIPIDVVDQEDERVIAPRSNEGIIIGETGSSNFAPAL